MPIFAAVIRRIQTPLALMVLLTLVWGCKDDAAVPPPPPPPDNSVTYTDPPAHGTPFSGIPETKDIVMYEVNLRAFSPQGTFAGVTARLDSIQALGANVIWLMPIYPVGQANSVGQLGSPYSVRDYKAVNSEFGSLDDLRTLVAQAHDRGIAVILDWVANHTSWDNPWIVNTTWYTKNQFGAITHPPGTNWLDVADLDFSSMAMRRAMINAMKYWILAANVDGYRCDYADGVPFAFWKQAIDTLHAMPGRDLILLAEGARTDHFTAGFQLNYAWDYFGRLNEVYDGNQPASALVTTHIQETATLPAGSFKLRFTANHDEVAWNDTPLGLFGGKEGSMAAFVLASFMGGVPLIYNGQEVGCPVKLPFFSKSPIDWTTHPDMWSDYKKLISVRKAHDAAALGALVDLSNASISAFQKTHGLDSILVFVNTTSSPEVLTLSGTVAEGTSWTNAMEQTVTVNLGTQVNLAPYEYLILIK